MHVDVSLCHGSHMKWTFVPRLPPEMKVDVTKYHACHANSRGVTGDKSGPSAQPHAISATPATQNDGGCEFVPHLPRETKVDVTKCHACHANSRGVTGDKSGPSAPPNAISATPATQNEGRCEFVPHLPRETKVDVTKCHACHANSRGVTGDKSGPSAPPNAISATPATQNDGGCEFVPHQPREMKVDVTKYHACHANSRGVTGDKSGPSAPPNAISATPATQNESGCEFVPHLPRETKVDVTKCHACHANSRGVTGDKSGPSAPHNAISATPATQNEGRCEFVPHLPRETKVDVTKCHACHANSRGVSAVCVWECVKLLYVKFVCVWSYCIWEMVCDKVVCVWVCVWSYCMLNLCVWSYGMWHVQVVIVCERWYVTKLCVCECVWSYCMLSLCVWSFMVCDMCGGGGRRREEEETRDTGSKTRTPHKVVGNKTYQILILALSDKLPMLPKSFGGVANVWVCAQTAG